MITDNISLLWGAGWLSFPDFDNGDLTFLTSPIKSQPVSYFREEKITLCNIQYKLYNYFDRNSHMKIII